MTSKVKTTKRTKKTDKKVLAPWKVSSAPAKSNDKLEKDLNIKELEALSHLAVNVRKLAKFKHETGFKQQQALLKIYAELINQIIQKYKKNQEN